MLPPYPAVVPCVTCSKPVEENRKCYAHPTCYACLPPPAPLPVAAVSLATFQRLVGEWALACFGEDVTYNTTLRNHRFLEEALELVQSLGCTANEAHRVVDYVFSRPVGEPAQELGGVMVTLATLCNAQVRLAAADPNRLPLHIQHAALTELEKNWANREKIREKSKNKPRFDQPEPGAAWAAVDALAARAVQPDCLRCHRAPATEPNGKCKGCAEALRAEIAAIGKCISHPKASRDPKSGHCVECVSEDHHSEKP